MDREFGVRIYNIPTLVAQSVKNLPASAQAWCTGKTQKDWVEREVGGGIGMGNTCKSMADSCQCMTRLTAVL